MNNSKDTGGAAKRVFAEGVREIPRRQPRVVIVCLPMGIGRVHWQPLHRRGKKRTVRLRQEWCPGVIPNKPGKLLADAAQEGGPGGLAVKHVLARVGEVQLAGSLNQWDEPCAIRRGFGGSGRRRSRSRSHIVAASIHSGATRWSSACESRRHGVFEFQVRDESAKQSLRPLKLVLQNLHLFRLGAYIAGRRPVVCAVFESTGQQAVEKDCARPGYGLPELKSAQLAHGRPPSHLIFFRRQSSQARVILRRFRAAGLGGWRPPELAGSCASLPETSFSSPSDDARRGACAGAGVDRPSSAASETDPESLGCDIGVNNLSGVLLSRYESYEPR